MTSAQRKALEAVRDGRVTWSHWRYRYLGAHTVRRDVLDSVVANGWVWVPSVDESPVFPDGSLVWVVLTEAGQEALR